MKGDIWERACLLLKMKYLFQKNQNVFRVKFAWNEKVQ